MKNEAEPKKERAGIPDFPNPMQPGIGPIVTNVKAGEAYNSDTELTNRDTSIDETKTVEGE